MFAPVYKMPSGVNSPEKHAGKEAGFVGVEKELYDGLNALRKKIAAAQASDKDVLQQQLARYGTYMTDTLQNVQLEKAKGPATIEQYEKFVQETPPASVPVPAQVPVPVQVSVPVPVQVPVQGQVQDTVTAFPGFPPSDYALNIAKRFKDLDYPGGAAWHLRDWALTAAAPNMTGNNYYPLGEQGPFALPSNLQSGNNNGYNDIGFWHLALPADGNIANWISCSFQWRAGAEVRGWEHMIKCTTDNECKTGPGGWMTQDDPTLYPHGAWPWGGISSRCRGRTGPADKTQGYCEAPVAYRNHPGEEPHHEMPNRAPGDKYPGTFDLQVGGMGEANTKEECLALCKGWKNETVGGPFEGMHCNAVQWNCATDASEDRCRGTYNGTIQNVPPVRAGYANTGGRELLLSRPSFQIPYAAMVNSALWSMAPLACLAVDLDRKDARVGRHNACQPRHKSSWGSDNDPGIPDCPPPYSYPVWSAGLDPTITSVMRWLPQTGKRMQDGVDMRNRGPWGFQLYRLCERNAVLAEFKNNPLPHSYLCSATVTGPRDKYIEPFVWIPPEKSHDSESDYWEYYVNVYELAYERSAVYSCDVAEGVCGATTTKNSGKHLCNWFNNAGCQPTPIDRRVEPPCTAYEQCYGLRLLATLRRASTTHQGCQNVNCESTDTAAYAYCCEPPPPPPSCGACSGLDTCPGVGTTQCC